MWTWLCLHKLTQLKCSQSNDFIIIIIIIIMTIVTIIVNVIIVIIIIIATGIVTVNKRIKSFRLLVQIQKKSAHLLSQTVVFGDV